ncbi:MAG: RNA polymerase sigma factor [Crocinitomicaceae bacterium]|jgi:RNA polymerase sigma-70 factor (ECF subfamily)|tara:strand:- start:13526 stop:14110 length:585 start_codon:yes stop_codon:yes gene_type:complete
MRIFKPQYPKLPDEELLVLMAKGDQRAFDEVYVRYSQPLFGYFMKLLARDKEKCEDMVHDLFAKIIRKPDYFDVNRSFRTWVYSVASNMCKNEYKRMAVRKNVKYDIEPAQFVQSSSDTLKTVHEKSFSDLLHHELSKMDEKHKSVFVLRHFDGFSMKEIAEALEINEGTVKSRLFYATKFLAGALKQFNPIYQ